MNHVGHIFVNIINAGLFNEVMHNFFCLLIVAGSGKENAKGSAINVVAVGRESFLPVVNRGIDVFAPLRWNVSVVFGFGL